MKIILSIFLLAAFLPAREVYKQVRIYSDNKEAIELLKQSGLEIDHGYREPGIWIEFAVSESRIHLLDNTQLHYDIIHEDLEQYYASRLNNEYESRDFDLGSMGGYYTFAEIEAQLDNLYLDHPNLITEKISLGETLEGRDIWMVKISDNPYLDEDEPEMLYTGLHHAREPMSYMNLFYFMNWLTENYGTDPEATALINSRELYFIPAVNPDGLVYNQQIAPNGGGMQRKNMRETCTSSADGIDLNRNYSYMWGYDNVGSSPDGCNETYRGTSPFSEPETQVIKEFVEAHNFPIALNYHSYSNLLIYPFGYDPSEPIPEEDFSIFVEYGEIMTQYNGYLLGTGIETVGYTVNGEACDWMYGEHGIFAYTPEIGNSSDGFWPSTIRIVPLAEENLFPNQFVAWSVGARYTIEFSVAEGPYLSGETYSTSLSIINTGLGDSNGPLTLSIDSPDNYFVFETQTVQIGHLESRSGFDLGDILTFQVLPSTPSGIITELTIHVTDEDNYDHFTTIDLILGEALPLAYYSFEVTDGWTVGDVDDDATAGLWELSIPVGTFFDGNQAQPGSDHSEDDSGKCFLTGAATSSDNVGFDDVDGGKTTLFSPIFNLSGYDEALVSYWRWYTNNVGDNPGTDAWRVDASSDGGQTWINIEYSNQSQDEWIQKNFILSELGVELTDQVKFRFIAEDIYNEGDSGSGGSIIEAAIDDFTLSVFATLVGDLNEDGILNILDVVVLVNYVLNNNCTELADLTLDNLCNVLDVVLLVNIILG
jgi:hypothetical protein